MTTFHQVLVRAGPGDAITDMALHARAELRRLGRSEVFARSIEPGTASDVGALQELPVGWPSDVVIYHSSVGDPEMTRALLQRPEQLVLVHHGFDSTEALSGDDPSAAAGPARGRHELTLLRHRVSVAIAASELDAGELVQLGYGEVHVAASGVGPGRLTGLSIDAETAQRLDEVVGVPFVLDASTLLPHGCQHVIVQALHVLQSVHRVELGLVLAGSAPSGAYARALHELTRGLRLQHVWFAGPRSDSSLATIYRRARVFCSAGRSEDRLGVRALDAMTFGVPVIVRGAGATPETVGRGALVLPSASGPLMFAEAVLMLDRDDRFRSSLVDAGFDRIREYSATSPTSSVADVVEAAGLAS